MAVGRRMVSETCCKVPMFLNLPPRRAVALANSQRGVSGRSLLGGKGARERGWAFLSVTRF